MKKYDCSRVLDYVHERNRMCRQNKCDESCPFIKMNECHTGDISQKYIDIVQKWSDEHPEQPKLTKREHEFLSAFMPFIKDRAIKRTPEGLYLIFHYAFSNVTNNEYIEPTMFPFISEGEEWYFDKLLGLEVEE